jgi:hypothetical protein
MVQDAANQLVVNKTAICAALAAVCSPAWLPSLHEVSITFAELFPIVGTIYLAAQLANFLITKRWRKPRDGDASSKDETT